MEAKRFFMKSDYPAYWTTKVRSGTYSEGYEKRAVDLLQMARGKRYLEAGAGEGRFIPNIREAGGEYVGLDISSEMLRKCEERDPTVSLVVADTEELPFRDDTFEGVLCFATIFFVPNMLKALKEMGRVSKNVVVEFRNTMNPGVLSVFLKKSLLDYRRTLIRCMLNIRLVRMMLGSLLRERSEAIMAEISRNSQPYYPVSFLGLARLLAKANLKVSRIEAYDLDKAKSRKHAEKCAFWRNWVKPALLVQAVRKTATAEEFSGSGY